MSTAYHYSPKAGEPRPCSNPANCPYGGEADHYPSPEAYYAAQAESQGISTLSTETAADNADTADKKTKSTAYGKTEEAVIDAFPEHEKISYQGHDYQVMLTGKPAASAGEGKTDAYIALRDLESKRIRELKFSVKAHNADWYENKMSSERFSQVFTDPERRDQITDQAISHVSSCAEEGSITLSGDDHVVLGYKLDMVGAHAKTHVNSFPVELTEDEAHEVIAGSRLSEKKRNSTIDGQMVPDSGTANTLLALPDNSILDASPEEARKIIEENSVDITDHVADDENRNFRIKLSALSYGSRGSTSELSRILFIAVDHRMPESPADDGDTDDENKDTNSGETPAIMSTVSKNKSLFSHRARDLAEALPADVRAKLKK